MNKAKKLFSLILCNLMLISMVSCSDVPSQKETNTPTGTSGVSDNSQAEVIPEYLDYLPDNLNYNGQKIRFAVQNDMRSIYVDEEEDDISDIVTEAVWKRNNTLMERLNVEFAVTDSIHYDNYNAYVMNSIQSNSDDYDVFQGHARFQINLASRGAMKNLDNIENLNLSKDYWGQNYINSISYNDIHYWATGDLSLGYIGTIYCMMVNNSLFDQLYPGQKIYDYVNDGTWSLDTMETLMENSYADLNGNGEADQDDRFGTYMHNGHLFNGMLFAGNMKFTDIDENGRPFVAIDNEHTYNLLERLGYIFKESPHTLYNSTTSIDTVKMFVQQKILFLPTELSTIENGEIRNMDDDFSLIPYPKYNNEQENYRCSQYDGVPLYGIPITANADNLSAIGATLECMCSINSQNVLPVYYDDALKSKYSRDPETAQMIDLITSSVVSDFSFSWGDTVGKYGASIQGYFYLNIGSKTIASKLAKNNKFWEKGMDELLDALDEYADN